jgi:mannan endo-1,4-beta-mannosidase
VTTTPPATTTPPPSGRSCTAAYSILNQWPGGFQGEVRVTAGTSAISGWTVTWTFLNGQTVTQAWSATVTSSGSGVTARNMSYNGSVAAGATTTFGFLGSWNGTNSVPTASCTAS